VTDGVRESDQLPERQSEQQHEQLVADDQRRWDGGELCVDRRRCRQYRHDGQQFGK
jgi:hypothetical protein